MKYAVFDKQGVLLTRLLKGANTIPPEAVPVDDALWLRLTQETDGVWRRDKGGKIYKADLPPPSTATLIEAANIKRDQLLSEAVLRMGPLQDAVALEKATASEQAALLAWMDYRVALNRIQTQPGYPAAIDWPAVPEQAA